MKLLRPFFMEDLLEASRFEAKFNLGESGGRARTVGELLGDAGLSEVEISKIFLQTPLCDSPNRGRSDLRALIAGFHKGATVDNVLVTTGTSEALFLLFRQLNPKSIALVLPAFQLLYELPAALGANIIALPLRYNSEGFPFIDEEEWLSIIEEKRPECLLINNPHNPSGLVLSIDFMKRLSLCAQRINCTFIGDEHYRFLSSEKEVLGESLYENNVRTFITGSFIKCFGVPGLRVGWCVGPKKVLDAMQNEKNYTTHTVNPVAEWISYEVLRNTKSRLFSKAKDEWIQNRRILKDFLSSSRTVYGASPEGGLVASIGFRHAVSLEKVQECLEKLLKNKIFVLPLSCMEFGAFSFQNEEFYKGEKLSLLNKGFGFRLGLGALPSHFEQALLEIEKLL